MEAQVFGPDYVVLEKLGEGAFADVFKVRSRRTGDVVAIKRLKKRYRSLEEVSQLTEISALRSLQGHPNIVRLLDILYDSANGFVAFVFELLSVNLYELIRDHKGPFDEKTALILIYQLLKALSFVHSKWMFHRDVKPENCMVDTSTFELKLVDFGSTRQTSARGPFTEYVSTRWYRAPECILTAGSYGPSVDIWAVGCMFYEILTSRPLFPGKHELDQICRIHNVLGTPASEVLAHFSQNPNKQINFSFPPRHAQDFRSLLPFASPEVVSLITGLLVYNPVDRITADEALDHPAFDAIRADEIKVNELALNVPVSAYYLFDSVKATAKPPKVVKDVVVPVVQPEMPVVVEQPAAPVADPRRVAVDRIKAYNQKHPVQKAKPKVSQTSMVGKPRLVKPILRPPPGVIGLGFVIPKPELVQPRLLPLRRTE